MADLTVSSVDSRTQMAKLLGIDIGTSGCKLILVDEHGRVLKQASHEYPAITPRPGWSEQDPAVWVDGVRKCLEEIGEPSPDAIGLTGQMHGSVFLDKEDKVLRAAILWNDQRTISECLEIEEAIPKEVYRSITCNPPLTGFQLPKVLWLRNNEPEMYDQVRTVLLPKDYIRLWLTGEKATDVSDASGTGAFDVPKRNWSAEILEHLKIPREWFPKVFESYELTGKTKNLGIDFPLAANIPIVAGGGDQAASAVGTGATVLGVVSVSLGTSGVVFTSLPSAKYDYDGAVHTFCHSSGGWHAMSVMLSCGGAVGWLKHNVFPESSFAELDYLASTIPAGCEGLTFLPYLTGERSPLNDPKARGEWAGLSLSHGKAHMARALLEGASFGLLDGFHALKNLGASSEVIRVSSGGAISNLWVQMLADIFDAPCEKLEIDEGPAFGAALLAGLGIGVFKNFEETNRCVRITSVISPQSRDSVLQYEIPYRRFKALYASTKSWFADQ